MEASLGDKSKKDQLRLGSRLKRGAALERLVLFARGRLRNNRVLAEMYGKTGHVAYISYAERLMRGETLSVAQLRAEGIKPDLLKRQAILIINQYNFNQVDRVRLTI